MQKLKAIVTASAGVAVVAVGLFVASPAEAIYCKANAIPPGYEPTGAPCKPGCESDLHENRRGQTFCAIYGPGF
jgi:hypothetical protein